MKRYLSSVLSPIVRFCSIVKLAAFTLFFLGGSFMEAQTGLAQKTIEQCAEVPAGVVVETVANHSEAEKAGFVVAT